MRAVSSSKPSSSKVTRAGRVSTGQPCTTRRLSWSNAVRTSHSAPGSLGELRRPGGVPGVDRLRTGRVGEAGGLRAEHRVLRLDLETGVERVPIEQFQAQHVQRREEGCVRIVRKRIAQRQRAVGGELGDQPVGDRPHALVVFGRLGLFGRPTRCICGIVVRAGCRAGPSLVRLAINREPASVMDDPQEPALDHWGQGHDAVLRYLARYVFRVAITNTRIVALNDHTVTIRYKKRKSSRWRTCRMPGHEFVRRFLQHVLPKGLHKVRYFGLWHPSKRQHAAQARLLLELERTTPPAIADQSPAIATEPRRCPCCGRGHLVYIRRLTPKNALGP